MGTCHKNTTMGKITALVSAYYAEEYIERRLNNLHGIDTVVVCRRNSAEHRISYEYPVRTIVTEDIPTIGKAWNIAIEAADGDYVFTANTDDLIYPEGLARMESVLDGLPRVGLVFGAVDIGDTKWQRIKDPTGILQFAPERLSRRCFIGPMPLWRKSLHQHFGMFDEDMVVACDYDMWLRFAFGGVGFYYIADSVGKYEKRADSLEHRNKHLIEDENRKARHNSLVEY